MSSFVKRFGGLTVAQAQELNKAVRWHCEHEVVSDSDINACINGKRKSASGFRWERRAYVTQK